MESEKVFFSWLTCLSFVKAKSLPKGEQNKNLSNASYRPVAPNQL